MTTLALSPNVSGTGQYTLSVPNTNSNRTLSLPDVTGNVLHDGPAAQILTGDISVPSLNSGQLAGMRNRIINGKMGIDQRNAGASVTPTASTYLLDRFRTVISVASKLSFQQSTDAPTGFSNSTLITVAASYTPAAGEQFFYGTTFEANNVGDLSFGQAGAITVTLSFWVKSSVTGTYSFSWTNDANDRSYIGTFTINAANTWEYKTATIPGDTTGTWANVGTGRNSFLQIGLGCGSTFEGTAGSWQNGNLRQTSGSVDFVSQTNGSTFRITGVQLEVGSVATPFEHRPIGVELALCQRYYYRATVQSVGDVFGTGYNNTTSTGTGLVAFPVTMRSNPTALEQSGTAGDYNIAYKNTSAICTSVPTFNRASINNAFVLFTAGAVFTQGEGCRIGGAASAYLGFSSEL